MLKQVKNRGAVLAIFDQQNPAQLPAVRIHEQPMLLTKSKINNLGYKFSRYICAKNGKSNLIPVLFIVLESKVPIVKALSFAD